MLLTAALRFVEQLEADVGEQSANADLDADIAFDWAESGIPNNVEEFVLNYLQEYNEAQQSYHADQLDSEATPITHRPQRLQTIAFQEDSPSLYVDAALDHKNVLTGTGFIFKIGHHRAVASHYRLLPGASTPIFAEGQALLHSLLWCLDSQLSPKFVFSDCLNLVSKVNSEWQDHSALSGLVSRIRMLFSNFPEASLHFLPRQFNMDAHGLAKEAIRSREEV
ncbi:hypothetical protein G4B88_019078 [Cannabis sativa]|uniref:RNase H type-1 domain-containing protein n=1 Tax=Cannabis sativa TaxID=3483 RepID=A0A7J6DLM2_CANSA|nr:hypothetical protein G4B88_019078 [Cannabis sativa]